MVDKKNIFAKGSKQISGINSNIINNFIFMDRRFLSFYEQLDFTIRQGSYVNEIFPKNDNVYFPFAENEWLRIVLNLSPEMRRHQSWYTKFANSQYKNLFDAGLKSTYGVRFKPYARVVRLLWAYNKSLSVLTGKKYGLKRSKSYYLSFYSKFPKALSQFQDEAFEYALEAYPILSSYRYRNPLCKSLVCSLGVSHVG